MKKIFLTVLIVFTFISFCFAKEVDGNRIKQVFFNIARTLGGAVGYVVFVDEEGNQCALKGMLTLSKKWIEAQDKKSAAKASNFMTRHLKNIEFNSGDFENMQLRTGDVIYALPIKLNANEVKAGDIVILEWHGFKIEREIY